MTLDRVINGNLKYPCWQCYQDKRERGRDHPNWRDDLTDEDREAKGRSRDLKRWSQIILKLQKFTCQTCGDDSGGNLEAHHLYSYRAYPEMATDLSNGVCLCETCHTAFHTRYGYGGNTLAQFIEFCKTP